jgi:hypothetical protein
MGELTEATFQRHFCGSKFLDLGDIDLINERFPEATFYVYQNQIGNWRKIMVIETDGDRYVAKRVDTDYPDSYEEIRVPENRPRAKFYKIDDEKSLGIFDFMGAEVIDFSDHALLEQLVNLGVESAKRKTSFDPNIGNLIVQDSQLFYIDAGLVYVEYKNFVEALFANISHTIQNLPDSRLFNVQRLEFEQKVLALYLEKIKSSEYQELLEHIRSVRDTLDLEWLVNRQLSAGHGSLDDESINEYKRLVVKEIEEL